MNLASGLLHCTNHGWRARRSCITLALVVPLVTTLCFCARAGLEYDLDLFNIVAVDDFNMGAMENKSLNIFNSRLVIASPATSTDLDYARVEGVVGHEYFHNWTGNRVTCRDWFQLTLKEGLTVFRDQVWRGCPPSDSCRCLPWVAHRAARQCPWRARPGRPHWCQQHVAGGLSCSQLGRCSALRRSSART